tara:strand:- start:449612 stop:449986 length:375 start_codon:yes stop_codon:yes gene_type:complete
MNNSNGRTNHHLIKRGVALVCLLTLAIAGVVTYNNHQLNQLPEAFTVAEGDTLVSYTRRDLPLAITVAERVGLPVLATTNGDTTLVSYKDARGMVNKTDTVRLVVPIYPGDFIDARNRIYRPAT